MLTKYILHIDGESYELQEDDLRNWADIKVSYKRSDFDGVVRAFSSQFDFVGRAKELLWELYAIDGVNAKAELSIHTINNNHVYEEQFRCPLDFSTLKLDSFTLSLNSVDNSLATFIKANKSTTYEFEVGKDIPVDGTFLFDRIPMQETATYVFSKGASREDSADIEVMFTNETRAWIGLVSSEVLINRTVYFVDDQTEDGYVLELVKDTPVGFEYDLQYYNDEGIGTVDLYLEIYEGGQPGTQFKPSPRYHFATCSVKYKYLGEYAGRILPVQQEVSRILGVEETADLSGVYLTVDNVAYRFVPVSNGVWTWENTGKTRNEFRTESISGKLSLDLKQGDKVVMMSSARSEELIRTITIVFRSSKMTFSWFARGESVNIDAIRPQGVLKALLERITDGGRMPSFSIADTDPRLRDTLMLPAESIRGLSGAKLYSSFNDFCDWMKTVFGYVYLIHQTEEGEEIAFVSRSSLFSDEAPVHTIDFSNDVVYSIDSSLIYSNVTIGYNQKDYGNINGRDEFNFNSSYSTGCSVSDKALSLLSKYRADCYGVEFAAQKRGEDTTDSTTDKDLFFAYCLSQNGVFVPARSVRIENALSDAVFNGEFSPLACLRANADFIGIMGTPLTLTFASSTGNSNIIIDGKPMSGNIVITDALGTAGILEFSTDEVDNIADTGETVKVEDLEGNTYFGFLKEVDVKYARNEAAKYKIIIKRIER